MTRKQEVYSLRIDKCREGLEVKPVRFRIRDTQWDDEGNAIASIIELVPDDKLTYSV